MSARVTAFVIWAAVAASAVFWLLRLTASSPSAPSHTVAVATSSTPRGDLTRLLGAPPVANNPSALVAEPALASRFKLLGVAAPAPGGGAMGLALIAVDGKPARSYKVGAAVEGEIVLQSVHARGIALGARDAAAAQVRLDLPPLPLASTSNRPPGSGQVGVSAPMFGVVNPPGSGPIATLPQPIQGIPPSSEAAEPAPLLVAPPGQNTR